jgi:glyoxylase-like metal-dependent hydrolase (beta-lactamase superfamily II)
VSVTTLDLHHLGVAEAIASYLIDVGDGRFALVDPGPGSTLTTLVSALEGLGWSLEQLSWIFVSHVHLDHAGAAGALAQRSGAQVLAHPRAARHLLDPSRLIGSATRIYGDAMDSLWGPMLPVPEGQLRVLAADEEVRCGSLTLRAIEAPGHAHHQHAYHLSDGSLFPGDAAAIRLPGQLTLMPATAPPEIDLEAWGATLTRFEALDLSALCLPHFGVKHDVAEHLARLREALPRWASWIQSGIELGEDDDALAKRLEAGLRSELTAEGVHSDGIERAIRAAGPNMCAVGLRRALRPLAER